ncbi:D-arabinono-1,4-lactone oxidase [Streptomyces sp. NBC_01465]|uniref:D-arabinono-1,4-lactone oxidase n=1 Tax=Streptomyces sp. NBC_01465 TaxID=2903878 RepID=UPI002E33DDCF|nr:D-arabinono-1,4-lactone oxidase [Streptomyces sp. NBC_01465]
MTEKLTNWAGNVAFRAQEINRPISLRELQHTVARSSKVRALGSRHSFSDIADTGRTLVCLDDLPPLFEIDSAAATVRITASMRYAELGRRLHEQGWALHNLASLPHISVAGACATGTHGSGDANGNLATAVTALQMVTADGEVAELDRDQDEDRFHGTVVALGALGIVTQVTLDLVPTFEVEQYVYQDLPFEALTEHFAEIFASAYSVSLFTDWSGPRINQMWLKRKQDDTGSPLPGTHWLGARLSDIPLNPLPGMSPVHATQQLGEAGPWHERLPHFRSDFTPGYGNELQSENFVPRRHAVAALRALDDIRAHIAPLVQISEVRTIAADELWMSPAHQQDIVAFHFTWTNDTTAVLPVLAMIEERLAPYASRPHWGKLFTTSSATLQSRYPRLPDFRKLARHWDPTGKFTNDFLDRTVFADL